MSLVFILGLLAAAAAFTPLCKYLGARWLPWIVPLPAALAFAILAVLMPEVTSGGAPAFRVEWVPAIGLDFALRLHGVGLLLAMLVTGIGALIMLYATGYMAGHPQAHRLYALLYAFMFSMAGLAISDHLLLLFIFWELTSITSYLIIGFVHEKADSRKNALQALVITGMGGLALLAGFILLASASGTWYLSEMLTAADVRESSLYPAILVLVLLGAFTKSAQVPFHFWLPNAMAAPTPVSAYLHSATMVKAGVFLLALMLPILGGTIGWTVALTAAGGATLLVGGLFGLMQSDLKRILAGTTVSVLGLLTMLLGIGTPAAVLAAVLFLLGHAFYKASLFMVAGSIDHEAGTREVARLGGLRKAMPWTAAAALLAALSKMGLPPLLGFLGKEYTYKATLGIPWSVLAIVVIVLGNALLLALAVKVAILPFWRGTQEKLPKHPHEAPWTMWFGPVVLALLSLVVGVAPWLMNGLVSAASASILGEPYEMKVKLWHGFNVPLLLSAITIAAGFILLGVNKSLGQWLKEFRPPSMEGAYDKAFAGTIWLSRWQTAFLQSGKLRNYLLITLVSALALISLKLWQFGGIPELDFASSGTPVVWALGLMMVGMTFLASVTSSRLTALVALGGIGFGVAMLFAIFSAPDLAITQVLVETLTVVLFALVVQQLPGTRHLSRKRTLVLDATIASIAGAFVTILVLKSLALDFGGDLGETLAEWSLPKAYGANVVNVILVDFRALDTLGEIIVLAIAALGVWALLQNGEEKQKVDLMPAKVLLTATRVLSPALFLLALLLLWRGHNLPGGGFIGGLIAASAVLLPALGSGFDVVQKRLPVEPLTLMILGLSLAVASGLFGLFGGDAFLTGRWLPEAELPIIGKIKLGTPILFDAGVFLTVIGFTLKCAFAMGTAHLSWKSSSPSS